MARSSSRLAVMGNPDTQLYWRAESLPWDEIEQRTNLQFSTEDREEIFQYTFRAEIERCLASGGVGAKDVAAYQQALLKHAKALAELTGFYAHNTGTFLGDDAEERFQALSLAIRDPDFDLGQTLQQTAQACKKLVAGLESLDFQIPETRREPEVIELAHFIAGARQGATATPARANFGYLQEPKVFEYHRWGLHLSKDNRQFAAFISAIFKRKVTYNQLKHAFTAAKELGLMDRPE